MKRSARNSAESSSLHPTSFDRHSNTVFSPSDIVGPSPVTSNGTDATEIEDEASEEVHDAELSPPSIQSSDSVVTVGKLYILLNVAYFLQ